MQAFDWDSLWRILALLAMNAAVASAAWRSASAWFAKAPCAERILAAGALFFAQIVFISAALGFSGLISLPAFAAAAFALFLGSRFLKLPDKIDFSNLSTGEKRVEALLPPVRALLILAAAGVAGAVLWGVVLHPPPGGDGFIYHLYFPAVWLQQGRISYVDLPYGVQAATYYPLNTELFYLWLMLPAHDDFLANAAQIPALVLGAVCVYALARRAGAGRNGAAAGAALALLVPGFLQQAAVARVDLFFSLWFLAALYFLYSWNVEQNTGQFILAGICWGLFLGTKSLAVPYSLLLFLPFVWFLRSAGPRRAFGSAVGMGAILAAAGGFWYIRNGLVTGNPFYPLELVLRGVTIFPGAYSRDAMTLFHARDPDVFARISDLFLGRWLGVFLGLCWFAAGLAQAASLTRRGKNTFVYLFLVPVAFGVLFWHVNPHNNLTNGRFLFPAILAACAVACLVLPKSRSRIGQVIYWAAVAAAVAAGLRGADAGVPGSDHAVRMWTGILNSVAGRGGLLNGAAPAFASLAAAMALGALAAAGTKPLKRNALTRYITVIMAFVLLVAGLCFSWGYQRETKYEWLAQAGVTGRGWRQVEERTRAYFEETGQRTVVASVGGERAYGLFGTGLRNRVVTVNVDGHPEWRFHNYQMELVSSRGGSNNGQETGMKQTERPQYHRMRANPRDWIRNLDSAGVQIVFAATLGPESMGFMEHTHDGFPVEVQWMRERPDRFRRVWSASSPVARKIQGASHAQPVAEAVEIYVLLPR